MTDEEAKTCVAIIFGEYVKSTREEQNLRKAAKSLYIFLTTSDEVEICMQSNSPDNCIHYYNVGFWIFLIQSYNQLTVNQWLKSN